MNIIHVAQFLGIGGLEKIIFHLAIKQQQMGHTVSVYIYDHERSWVDFFRSKGINVVTPEIKKDGYDLSTLKRMNSDLIHADIVHSHDLNPLMYLGPLFKLRRALFLKTPKLVHTTHGLDHVKTYPRGMLYQRIFAPMTDHMIGVSEKIGKFYLEEIKLNPKKTRVIPNGIDTYTGHIDESLRKEKKKWLANRHSLDKDKPIILSLSRVLPLKNQAFLIKALEKRPSLQLIIVGPSGDDQYFENLKLKESQNIKLVGSQELVSDYNLGADVYVSASRHEGIPVAVLEAMTVKTPCLVSDIAGHRTLLKHAQTLTLFAEDDEADFLSKLDQLINDKEQFNSLTENAYAIVEKEYSVTQMVSSYLEEYSK